jgi:hypothetical protein
MKYVEDEEDWLFPDLKDKMVNALVKEVAIIAGLKGKYTGHSLRIGGATAKIKRRLSIDQI